jgi:hypothetical protein
MQDGNKPPKIIVKGKPGFIAQLGYPHEGNREANAARIVEEHNALLGIHDPAEALQLAREALEKSKTNLEVFYSLLGAEDTRAALLKTIDKVETALAALTPKPAQQKP